MNVTPLAPVPTTAAPAGTETAAAPGDFLAVLAAALGTEQGSADAGTAGTGTTGEQVPALPADPCPPVPTDEAEENAEVPATPEVNPDLAAELVTTGAVVVTPAAPAAPAVTPAVPGAAHRSENGAEHQRADEAPGRLHAAQRPSLTRGTEAATPTDAATTPAAAPAADQATPQAAAAPAGPQQAGPALAPSTTGPAPVSAPVAAAPVAAAAATPAVAPSAQLDQVTAQVFPEITGLVSRGPGTHRITLTLQPEQLGEVRVVMTLRQGEVHVRLAAGSEARVSLSDGSAELVRMLEHIGVTDSKIVVRELPAAATQTSPTLPTSANPDAHQGAGGERTPDQNARTRPDHLATDGAADPRNHRPSVAAEVRPIHPVTGSRNAGVDLTM